MSGATSCRAGASSATSADRSGDHMRLRFRRTSGDYNVLQKLTYLGNDLRRPAAHRPCRADDVAGLDAAFPWLVDLFGGRQTARTIHFICATLIVLFVIVHVIMVLLSGVWNNIRSMITGRYASTAETADGAAEAELPPQLL